MGLFLIHGKKLRLGKNDVFPGIFIYVRLPILFRPPAG